MAADAWHEPLIQFDLFELDAQGHQLRRNGLPVDLPPQALRILTLLAAHPNRLVTRQELKDLLWPDESHGDFDSRLNFSIKKLREALGDNAEHPRYICTERGVGYRFIVPVRPPQGSPSGATDLAGTPLGPTPAPTGPASSRFGRTVFLSALLVLACIAALGSYVMRSRGTGSSIPASDPPSGTDHVRPEISSVTPIFPQARQRIVIKGRGLGLHVPYARTDSPHLAIWDNTARWAAGRVVPHNYDDVMLDVESWTDDKIVIGGFSGDYGKNGWKLTEGDELEIAVWNPQNGVGPARYRVHVSAPRVGR